MPYNVLLVGAGQLGSRYLQGLSLCPLDLEISVVDSSPESLARAQSRWEEVSSQSIATHVVSYLSSLPDTGSTYDLAIIATGAFGRARLVEECAQRFAIRYWILEKVLAQSLAELDMIGQALVGAEGTWVNTPRRIMQWHQQLRQELDVKGPITCSVSGGNWGLACNSVHFLDMFAWWTGKELSRIDTGGLASTWYESKRPGYYDVYGAIVGDYNDGSRITLKSVPAKAILQIAVESGESSWVINERDGTAICADGRICSGSVEFQSSLTGPLVTSILNSGDCGLPTLHDSLRVHRPFVTSMLEHWNNTMPEKRQEVPLT